MAALPPREQLLQEFDKLPPDKQKRVIDFTRQLSSTLSPGIPGEVLIERAREINFPPEDLMEIERAINEGCGRIDQDGW